MHKHRQQRIDDFIDPGFSASVIEWQKEHGRHVLPWQNTRDAYRIWLSEIMLQQTQVAAVIPYYGRFLARFPDVLSLAAAPAEAVMSHWSGLGYYSRARNLHRCAQRVVAEYGGTFPADPALLAELPGIGRSTAAAIAAFSQGVRAAILDANVKRVLTRAFGIDGYPGAKAVEDALWLRAQALLPHDGIEAYTQGLMDLGATLCTRSKPACGRCPLVARCVAHASDRVALLPMRKPKPAVPHKQSAMLVITDRDQVLLQQRPDNGIWGGLLSLPEVDGQTALNPAHSPDPAQFAQSVARIVAPFGSIGSCEQLPSFSHGFTHFKLQVTPYRVRLERRLTPAGQGGHVWHAQSQLADAALPAPVKKLLLALFEATGTSPQTG
ncbi:A/G-specific adenine glycosylase [Herminiimonas sp. CN]|uniref:A/G-specific adenine glycosylase n=1 Tax=Herminiimonas sp. CN TaxID=1349818 RepID=UPI0004736D67|nr:A/G-specific adenine glycosylase [Herminiimonas sp. CN]